MTTLVIFGASSNIGRAILSELAADYTKVICTYCRQKPNISDLDPQSEVEWYHLDLRNQSELDCFFEDLLQNEPALDCMIFCAATMTQNEIDYRLDKQYLDDSINVNLISAMRATVMACELMQNNLQSENKAIVLVGSEAGIYGGNNIPFYAASKGGLIAFVKGYARFAAKFNVRINIVSPSIVDSGFNAGLSQSRLASLPLGRAASPTEIAKTIVWLCSSASSYISGTCISVSGAR